MANVMVTYGNRYNGQVLDMNASIEGSGRIQAEARFTSYGWLVEPRDPERTDLFESVGSEAEAAEAVKRVALAVGA